MLQCVLNIIGVIVGSWIVTLHTSTLRRWRTHNLIDLMLLSATRLQFDQCTYSCAVLYETCVATRVRGIWRRMCCSRSVSRLSPPCLVIRTSSVTVRPNCCS